MMKNVRCLTLSMIAVLALFGALLPMQNLRSQPASVITAHASSFNAALPASYLGPLLKDSGVPPPWPWVVTKDSGVPPPWPWVVTKDSGVPPPWPWVVTKDSGVPPPWPW